MECSEFSNIWCKLMEILNILLWKSNKVEKLKKYKWDRWTLLEPMEGKKIAQIFEEIMNIIWMVNLLTLHMRITKLCVSHSFNKDIDRCIYWICREKHLGFEIMNFKYPIYNRNTTIWSFWSYKYTLRFPQIT